MDERDQHILTSVNSFSTEKWDETYGYVYGNLIKKGAKTVMVGHIAQPAYVKALNPQATREEMLRPASLSKELLTGLLREKLGFNLDQHRRNTYGWVYRSHVKRSEAIVQAINAGCDMILFNKSLEEDFGYLLAGAKTRNLSMDRLDEAVLRIPAKKRQWGFIRRKRRALWSRKRGVGNCGAVRSTKAGRKKVADQAITLVRDEQELLSISPKKYKWFI